MKYKRKLILFWIVFTCETALLACTSSAQENPTLLIEQVKKVGAKSVVSTLWEKRGEWAGVMNRIASGQEAWVELVSSCFNSRKNV